MDTGHAVDAGLRDGSDLAVTAAWASLGRVGLQHYVRHRQRAGQRLSDMDQCVGHSRHWAWRFASYISMAFCFSALNYRRHRGHIASELPCEINDDRSSARGVRFFPSRAINDATETERV